MSGKDLDLAFAVDPNKALPRLTAPRGTDAVIPLSTRMRPTSRKR
jgi:hypothetical protein